MGAGERYHYQAGTADRYATMIEEYFSSGNGRDEELALAEEEGARAS